jgi:hypothetical protein
MKAKLMSYTSPDIEDLWTYVPSEPDNFQFLLELFVGAEGESGEDMFCFVVGTPRFILEHNPPDAIVVGRPRLIVFKYDFPSLIKYVEAFVDSCAGGNWRQVAEKLSRLTSWEFDDYVPDKP